MKSISDNQKIECLNIYFNLLKKEEYFKAHEVAEELWHLLRRSNDFASSYFKGLINAAIALEHLKRDKPKSKRVAVVAYNSFKRRCKYNNILNDNSLYNIDIVKDYIDSKWIEFGMDLYR